MQNDTRELEARARALEHTLAERRARSQQASASHNFPDSRQPAFARDAGRGGPRAFQQQQQQPSQQPQQFAGADTHKHVASDPGRRNFQGEHPNAGGLGWLVFGSWQHERLHAA